MSAFKRILVPTDFSPLAAEAFRVAVGLAAPGGGEVVVVHVTREVAVVVENGPVTTGWTADKRSNLWDDFRGLRSDESNVRVTHELVAGRVAAAEIVELMEKFGCDLIVLGSRARAAAASASREPDGSDRSSRPLSGARRQSAGRARSGGATDVGSTPHNRVNRASF